MASSQQDNPPIPSPEPNQSSLRQQSIPPSNYLTVPGRPESRSRRNLLPGSNLNEFDDPDCYLRSTATVPPPPLRILPSQKLTPPSTTTSPSELGSLQSHVDFRDWPTPIFMSIYSTSSGDSEYSIPPARPYKFPSLATMSESRKISPTEKDQMIEAIRAHRVNTLLELRRIEQAFALLGSPDVTEPMTAAWTYYVNSHNLLTELRAVTKNYPFSAEVLEEAKRRVYSDPRSNRSWNFCWLVLNKVQTDGLILYYAQYQASQPTMWGNHTPTSEGVTQLTNAFVAEWNRAISQMLRNWDQPPSQ